MRRTHFVVAVMLLVGAASIATAQDAKKTASKTDKPVVAKTDKPAVAKTDDKAQAAKGEKPKATPGWVVVEEDWWFPMRSTFLDSIHMAGVHYRAQELKSASADIDKAIMWLKYAENDADKTTAEDLSIARSDLFDFSETLKSGKPVLARNLNAAFSHAAAALAKYHHFKWTEALADEDLKTAGRHLIAAVEHVSAAARSANSEYGNDLVDIYDQYAPYGYWDETIVFDNNRIAGNLDTVKAELQKLATKLEAGQ